MKTLTKQEMEEWAQANKDHQEAQKEAYKSDLKILNIVESKVSETVYKDILDVIKESDCTDDYSIEKEPKGNYQEEDFEELKGVWVDQTTNGGFTGDEFAGTISIEIGENEYFQFYYSM